MRDFSRSQFASSLLQLLTSRVAADRMTTAELLADLAEVDRRRLCVGAGYPSQHAYCVRELQMSEDAASKRIHAARAARDVPQIFEAVADGRLHLASVVLLAPHLTLENAEALLSSAARKTKREVEQLIASRFPRAELLPMVLATPRSAEHAPGHVEALGAAAEHAPGHVPPAPSRLTPIASDRDAWHFSVPREMTELLEYAQHLASHATPSRDPVTVLHRALKLFVRELERRRFAETARPRQHRKRRVDPHHIPARIKNAVWKRDGGRCTFVSDTSHRCDSRDYVQFDHIEPVARGGQSTLANLRLRCRAHNQYAAEQSFGHEFMQSKREMARIAQNTKDEGRPDDLVLALRTLGYRAADIAAAAARSPAPGEATIEKRVKAALRVLTPELRTVPAA